jgi:hypothetical protein
MDNLEAQVVQEENDLDQNFSRIQRNIERASKTSFEAIQNIIYNSHIEKETFVYILEVIKKIINNYPDSGRFILRSAHEFFTNFTASSHLNEMESNEIVKQYLSISAYFYEDKKKSTSHQDTLMSTIDDNPVVSKIKLKGLYSENLSDSDYGFFDSSNHSVDYINLTETVTFNGNSYELNSDSLVRL